MDCKACRREIEWAARGQELSAAEARSHLASCPACRQFRDERRALRELVAAVEPVVAPPDFDWKLRARLASERSAGARGHFRLNLAPGLPAITFAAMFVLLIAAAVYLKQSRPDTTPAVAATNAPAPNGPITGDRDSAAPVISQEGRDQLAAATANAQKSPAVKRQRAATGIQLRSPRSSGEAASAAVAATSNREVRSNDFSSGVAPVITLFSVPVRMPVQPVKVLLDEGSGTLRTVALQPVTFGSQEILRRSAGSSSDAALRPDRSAEEIW